MTYCNTRFSRAWLKSKFGVDLRVLSFAEVPVNGSLKVNTLAANHPSFIYNALSQLEKGSQPTDKQMLLLMRIMQQDLIAANWHPSSDPREVLELCKRRWTDPAKQTEICELTQEQLFDKTPDEAAKLCATLPKPSPFLEKAMASELDAELDWIRTSLGALDGRASRYSVEPSPTAPSVSEGGNNRAI